MTPLETPTPMATTAGPVYDTGLHGYQPLLNLLTTVLCRSSTTN